MVNLDYLYKPEIARPLIERNYFSDKKLSFQIIEQGTIIPHKDCIVDGRWKGGKGGILRSNGEYIKSSFINLGGGRKPDAFYTPPRESIQRSSETVIYLTLFFPVWGHVITDNIRRLWFLNNDALNKEFKNCPIVYIPWNDGKKIITLDQLSDSMRLLEILGVDPNRLRPITQPTQFDKIILFDESFSSSYFTTEYREMIDRVRSFALKNRTPTSFKKIYFYYGQRQMGEERLAEYFKSKGYEIITHQQRTNFDEELNLLINADSFASTLGSCGHNCIFLRDNSEAILVLRTHDAFTGYQQVLDQVHPLNSVYVGSCMSIFGYFFLLSKQLKSFFGDKWTGYEDEDFKNFLRYVKLNLEWGSKANPNRVKGLGDVFENFMAQLKKRKDIIAAYEMPPRWDSFQPTIFYQTHVGKKGWGDGWKIDNQISNPLEPFEQVFYLQAIKVKYPSHKVYYSVYFDDEEGWSEEVMAPEIAGTTGKTKPIYGMKVRLDEAGAKEFDILYRMHKFDGTWTPWAKNGENLYSYGQKLNAIQIKLEPVKIQSETKDFNYQTFLLKDDEIYLQGQRPQIKLT